MTILPFSTRSSTDAGAHASWLADLQAALDGSRDDAHAQEWRTLRDDIRALATPIDPAYSQQLAARLQPVPRPATAARGRTWLRAARRRLRAALPRRRIAVSAGAAATVAAAAVAVLIAAPWTSQTPGTHIGSSFASEGFAGLHAPAKAAAGSPIQASSSAASKPMPSPALRESTHQPSAHAVNGPLPLFGPFSRRVQQLSASLTLATSPNNVQSVSGRVSAIATEDHGFVRSSHVETQRGGESEARMSLSLPSARLNEALAAIEKLASVRSKSQSLLDITGSYNYARTRLANAKAERRALLRALAAAYTQAQIESLHAQLSEASNAIANASRALHSVSHRARTSEVQVSIVGDPHHGAAASGTLDSGLHDAGHVLVVALVVLLIGAAALIPLALLAALLMLTHRLWRRSRRERALDAA